MQHNSERQRSHLNILFFLAFLKCKVFNPACLQFQVRIEYCHLQFSICYKTNGPEDLPLQNNSRHNKNQKWNGKSISLACC